MKGKQIKYLILMTVMWFAVLACTGRAEAADYKTVSGTCDYDYAYQVLKLVNEQRSKAGGSSLVMDEELLKVAMMRAAECTVEFSHSRPNGTLCFDASDKMYGENIAMGYGTPKAVVSGWMSSAGHKANILNSSYQSIGIGCFHKGGSTYWVQCFGFDEAQEAANPGNSRNTYQVSLSASKETTLIKTESVQDEEPEEGDNPLATKVSGFKVKAGSRKLTLTWKKKAGVDGYRIQVSTSKSFKNGQTFTVKSGTTKKVIKKINGKQLKKNKKYYVRISAYIKSEGADGTERKQYSKWQSASKKTK
ncbi:MAG: CAP domain-containing protein [Clostridium sp.]|nr:CAP domain-containing protein [Clostridium sp.]